MLALGAVLGVLFVPTPYVLVQPGSVRPAETRIDVDGAPTFDGDGDILFTTVLVNDATVAELIRGNIDDAIVVRKQEEIYGTQGRDETREANRRQMDLSKLVATMEALEYLGYSPELTGEGARVLDVAEDAPAHDVLEPGDVIVAVDGAEVSMPDDLRAALSTRAPGDTVTVSVDRPTAPSGESASAGDVTTENLDLEVALDSSSEDADRAILGVVVDPADPTVDAEVEVTIESGSVTGPSAGLAWSLGVIDVMTPEPLLEGRDVAVTGEILPDGSVGAVGAVAQKVSTVVRNGVDLFLYPADTPEAEQRRMRELAGDDAELVAVSSLEEAVEALHPGPLTLPG